MNEYTIRPFQPGDLPALTALYNHYILHTTATFNDIPLTEQEMLAKVETAHRDNCPFLVLETADGALQATRAPTVSVRWMPTAWRS